MLKAWYDIWRVKPLATCIWIGEDDEEEEEEENNS